MKTPQYRFYLLYLMAAGLILLFLVAIYIMRLQASGNERVNHTTELRLETFLLADQLRQSSDDLTRMVRSYSVTGKSFFEDYFWTILDIREGKAPRPKNYDKIFWDFMTGNEVEPFLKDCEKVSLEMLMKKAGFLDNEFKLLEEAKRRSDELVNLENTAMHAMKGKFIDDKGDYTISRDPDPDFARQILFGEQYHIAKKSIMEPINEFFLSIDQRTNQTVEKEWQKIKVYQASLTYVLISFVMLLLIFMYTYYRYYKYTIKQLEIASKIKSQEIEEYKKVEKIKSEFLSTAAHELRTPLTSIQGFSEILMSRKNIKPEEQGKFLTYINEQAVGLGSIVNDLFDLSRIDSRKGLNMVKEKCNAGDTIRAIVGYTEKAYPECRFVLELSGGPADILADKARMTQVLKNLIGNAVKFSTAGCTVRIDAKVVDGNYQVSIQDEGIGMTSEETEKMFDRFYRADSSSTAKEGTGLGMSIVKHIVEAHDGKIWVESEAGKGTTVTFSIPMS